MFPPTVPRLPPLHWRAGAGGGKGGATSASFHPQPVPASSGEGVLHLPPPGAGRQGIIPYGGRLLPLPAGVWHELALARAGDDDLKQVALLDRIEDNHLTGLILLVAPGPLSGAVGPVELPSACADPGRLVGHILPTLPGQSPLTHECWAITPVDMQAAATNSRNEMLKRGLARLGEFHVAVPDHMLAVSFVRSDDTGWQIVTIMLPDRHPTPHRLEDWAARFAIPIHKGFDRSLTAADLPPAVAKDPD